jgi:membrane fusion protein
LFMSLFRKEVAEHRRSRLHGQVVLTQSLSTQLLVTVLVGIFIAAAAWMLAGSYSRIENVRGILVTDRPSAKVYAPVAGLVTDLLVKEGDFVRKGEKIAVVDLDRHASSGTGVIGDSLGAVDARREIGEEQIALSKAREDNERTRLMTAMRTAEDQSASLRGQISLQKEMVGSNETLFEQTSKLVERGIISKVEYERKRQALIAARQSLASLEQQLAAKVAEVAGARTQLSGLKVESARNVADLRAGQQLLVQQRAQLEGQRAYIVAAPISGRVTALQVASGRTANANTPMLVIVPEGAALKAELYAPSRAIGFVHSGQETRLLYDAFPYQRFGSFGGKILSVSRIVIDPRETDIPLKLEEPVYRVIVSLDQQVVRAFGERTALQPGMTLDANIVLERQSFLDWLLKPLKAVRNRVA